MIFSSTLFVFLFLPAVVALHFAIPKRFINARNYLLLAASLIFYGWGEPVNILVMLGSIVGNYLFGRAIGAMGQRGVKTARTVIFVLAVAFNLGILFYFKYLNFAVANVDAVFGLGWSIPGIALPIGVSFFTFHIMSYTVDVYLKKVEVQRNPLRLALFISFFPYLLAGPIVRYSDVGPQLGARECTAVKFAEGAQRFIIGFAKKILIANQVAVFADLAFGQSSPTAVMAWVGVICYALQIYFDFSGYSDMALGLGRMFGFQFLENFNYPYISRSVREFWRRWHISLSSWFRDYVYIPLGGNRRGKARTYINLLIVFFVTGLWHGASWTFVLWGLWHGLFMLVERVGFGKILDKLPGFVSWLYTTLVWLLGWVMFRAASLSAALAYLRAMFDFASGGLRVTLANIDLFLLAAIVLGCVFSAPVLKWLRERLFGGGSAVAPAKTTLAAKIGSWAAIAGSAALFVGAVVFLTGSDFNPFLYFRF